MSIEHFFLNLVGLTWDTRAPLLLRLNDDEARGPERLAHLYASEYVRFGHIEQAAFDEYFKFSFVRNPWARLVSEYRWRHYDLRYTFREFVVRGLPGPSMKDDYRHIVPQCEFTHDADGRQIVDFIGRFERLQQDFTTVCANLGIERSELPYVNSSDSKARLGVRDNIRRLISRLRQPVHSSYVDYYDKQLRDRVAEMYAKDIATFGYSFDDAV